MVYSKTCISLHGLEAQVDLAEAFAIIKHSLQVDDETQDIRFKS